MSGCIWLPRMLGKARRVAGGVDGNLIDGEYMFGDGDFADGMLLRFLGLRAADVLAIVRSQPEDRTAAAHIVARSGKTPAQCAAFNRRFRLVMGPFLSMIDADEGRIPRSGWSAFLRGFYNGVIFKPALAVFRRGERARRAP